MCFKQKGHGDQGERTYAGESRPQLPSLLLHQPAIPESSAGFLGPVPAVSKNLHGLPAISPHLQVGLPHTKVPLLG